MQHHTFPLSNISGVSSSVIRPTRLISCAWGEKYCDELLNLTLPAMLASGNLPYVASTLPCEVILLIEERSLSQVSNHPIVNRVRRLCPVRLIGLDDLISSKDKYGMSLTYALHRGLVDLGTTVTDTYLLFLNADFVAGEACFRQVLAHLMQGQRLVAAPSYCVVSDAVAFELRKRVNPETGALSIAHRELAGIALRNLHDTVRGKILNQVEFHLTQMDQFYWRLDRDTLLGHQMPIAIVGMRPERFVDEPNTYWDYGLIREFCPTTHPCVLGDSDEFIMIELREQFIAKNQVTQGPLDPRKIGERMVGWVTSYQRDFAKYPLTLHTKDLLPVVSTGRVKLAACVQEILSHSPRVPGSHLDHPQWNYHLAPFRRARHQYLSSRLGALTATERPPQWLFAIDQLWWLLDGLRKRHARIRAELEQAREADLRRLREQISMSPREQVFFDIRLNGPPCFVDSFPTPRLEAETLRNHQGQLALINEDLHPIVGQIENAMRRVNRHYDERLKLLDQNCATERAILEKEYNLLMKKHARSAEIPVVRVAPRVDGSSAQNPVLNRLIELGLKVSIGTRLLIYRSVIRHLRQVVASAALRGARNVLVVSASPAIISSAAYRFPGIRVFVSTEAAYTGNLARSLDENLKFDLCMLDLNGAELSTFSERLEEVVSCMNAEGTAIGWYLNHGRSLLPESISVDDSISVHIDLAPFPSYITALEKSRKALGRCNRAFQRCREIGISEGWSIVVARFTTVLLKAIEAGRRKLIDHSAQEIRTRRVAITIEARLAKKERSEAR